MPTHSTTVHNIAQAVAEHIAHEPDACKLTIPLKVDGAPYEAIVYIKESPPRQKITAEPARRANFR